MTDGKLNLKHISFPTPAEGWVGGVYNQRTPSMCNGGSVRCRRFREREETGWGVFEYHEGDVYEFDAALRDYEVTTHIKCTVPVSAYCDDVRVCTGIGGEAVTFTIRPCFDTSRLWFSPDLPDGEDEIEAEIDVLNLSLSLLQTRTSGRKPTLFLASDSTVQTYDPYYYPQTGWGEVLYRYFMGSDLVHEYRPERSTYSHCRVYELPGINLENRSIGGRSSRSFFLEGKWDELLARAVPGDYIMIQFGHNDSTKARPNRYAAPSDYKLWLTRYISSALARGITPILVTPVMRRSCGEGSEFTLSFPEYSEKLFELAEEFDVPLLDLGAASLGVCRTLGAEGTKRLYLWAEPGEYEGAYANGVSDNTHLSRTGALVYAGEVARLLAESSDKRLSPLGALVDMRRREIIKEALNVN